MPEPKPFGGAQWINRADVDELLAELARAEAELEAARPVVEAAVAYENRWRRYAALDPGAPLAEVRLAKAEAHQALLNAVRAAAVDLYRSATTRNLDSDVPDPSLDAETLDPTEEKP